VRRDPEAIDALTREHLAPDFEFESVLTGQVYKGVQGAQDLVADLWETLDWVAATEEVIDLDGQVVAVQRSVGRGTRSGVPVSQELAIVWTFEEGKIVRGRSFKSRAEALEAAGLRE